MNGHDVKSYIFSSKVPFEDSESQPLVGQDAKIIRWGGGGAFPFSRLTSLIERITCEQWTPFGLFIPPISTQLIFTYTEDIAVCIGYQQPFWSVSMFTRVRSCVYLCATLASVLGA